MYFSLVFMAKGDIVVVKCGKVYCPDGTDHLVDEEAVTQNIDLIEQQIELLQLA